MLPRITQVGALSSFAFSTSVRANAPLTYDTSAGQRTGPITGEPPSTSDETKAALLGAAKTDPIGQHDAGKDGGDQELGKKVKSEKERTCAA